ADGGWARGAPPPPRAGTPGAARRSTTAGGDRAPARAPRTQRTALARCAGSCTPPRWPGPSPPPCTADRRRRRVVGARGAPVGGGGEGKARVGRGGGGGRREVVGRCLDEAVAGQRVVAQVLSRGGERRSRGAAPHADQRIGEAVAVEDLSQRLGRGGERFREG